MELEFRTFSEPLPRSGDRVFFTDPCGEYFSWLEEDPVKKDELALFASEGLDLAALSPVAEDCHGVPSNSPRPPPLASPEPTPADPTDFDPDKFLDDFLASPEGQMIMNEDDAPMTLDEAALLEEPANFIVLENIDMDSLGYLAGTGSRPVSRMTTEPPAVLPSPVAAPCSPPSPDDRDVDLESDEDGDPEWLPGSTGPPSVASVTSIASSVSSAASPRAERRSAARHPRTRAPKRSVEERRERKKYQNRVAAVRYRQKKREEQHQAGQEYSRLNETNIRIKARLDTTREDMAFFKKFMLSVLRAQGR